jgi:aminoglycoside phosphotransferase (APT) family kinase protein
MIEKIDESSLGDWLKIEVQGFQGSFRITKFKGGQSNPTYKIEAQSGSYVLRRKPFGDLLPSAHAIEREYWLLTAIWPLHFPVPRPIALCTDKSVIGAAFYVMELAQGQNHRDGGLPQLAGPARRAVYMSMTDTLAALHSIDVQRAGLKDYGKHGNYFARQVSRWTRQYRDSQTDNIPEMESLIGWLPKTLPAQTGVSIVHGDYRIDNLIFDTDNRVVAVLDWELSTLGDPIADFSYFALQWALPCDGAAALGGLDLPSLCIPGLGEIISRYCAGTGRAGLPDLDWYFAYNLFRIAGIVQGIRKRVADGTASHAQAHETAARVEYFAKAAWTFALKFQSSRSKLKTEGSENGPI